jgi:hypothetical protein
MPKILLGVLALAQIICGVVLVSPNLLSRVSADVQFYNQATKTWDKYISNTQITVSPAGSPAPAVISQITTVIPAPPNTHSH